MNSAVERRNRLTSVKMVRRRDYHKTRICPQRFVERTKYRPRSDLVSNSPKRFVVHFAQRDFHVVARIEKPRVSTAY